MFEFFSENKTFLGIFRFSYPGTFKGTDSKDYNIKAISTNAGRYKGRAVKTSDLQRSDSANVGLTNV